MSIILRVVLSGPVHDAGNLSQVSIIFIRLLRVTWDVNSVNALELLHELLFRQVKVNRDDTGASGLEEVSVRALEETGVGSLQVVVPLIREGLSKHTNDRLVGLGAYVMTGVNKNWLALVTAKMSSSMATIFDVVMHSWLTQVVLVSVEFS